MLQYAVTDIIIIYLVPTSWLLQNSRIDIINNNIETTRLNESHVPPIREKKQSQFMGINGR